MNGKLWTEQDITILKSEYTNKSCLRMLAHKLDRNTCSVYSRAKLLGLVKKRLKAKKPGYKICSKCVKELLLNNFYINNNNGKRTCWCRTCINTYALKDYHKNPDRHRNQALKRIFNITLDIYNKILAKQKGVCMICGKPETVKHSKTSRVKNLAVDHNHKTGRVRGLLCITCNQALGAFKDDAYILRKAAAYIDRGNSRYVRKSLLVKPA